MTIAYSPDALVYDADTNSWSLKPGYDITQDRVDIQFSDDDAYIDGDWSAGEIGDDGNQTAVVTDMQGGAITSGQVYSEEFHNIEHPDGTLIEVDVIEINGVIVGFVVNTPLAEGIDYQHNGTVNVGTEDDTDETDTRQLYSNLQDVPCFGPGTHLMTTEGEVPVEWLAVGDRLITRDHGPQEVLWIGRFEVGLADMLKSPNLVPVAISAGALGPSFPSHDTLFSTQHRVLISGYQVALNFGAQEALIAAKHLINGINVGPATMQIGFKYTHVLLAQHEIIQANNIWVESLFLGQRIDAGLARIMPRALLKDQDLHAGHRQTARICLKRWEVAAMMGKRHRAIASEIIHRVA